MNKATRNWRIAFQISKFYVEPQYPRDIRREEIVDSWSSEWHEIESFYCPNCGELTVTSSGKRRITNGNPAIRCDILGKTESDFFCNEQCIMEYSRKYPNVRITMESDDN